MTRFDGTRTRSSPPLHPASRRAFTLVELLTTILIIAFLITIVVISVRAVIQNSRSTAERQTISGMKLGVESFKQEFGFLPPLVLHDDDQNIRPILNRGTSPLTGRTVFAANIPGGPVASSFNQDKFLEGFSATNQRMTADFQTSDPGASSYIADNRFSEFTLAYYLVGALPASVDGVEGPGMWKPLADGTFEAPIGSQSANVRSSGRIYGPFVDTARNQPRLALDPAVRSGDPNFAVRYRLVSPSGTPYRYYRWSARKNAPMTGLSKLNEATGQMVSEDDVDKLGVPSLLGDPRTNADLRSAEFAIVSAGADGVFGDMRTEAATPADLANLQAKAGVSGGADTRRTREAARRDNVVEVGR